MKRVLKTWQETFYVNCYKKLLIQHMIRKCKVVMVATLHRDRNIWYGQENWKDATHLKWNMACYKFSQ